MIVKPETMTFAGKKVRILIAGFPGIGKTTLALSAPKPLYIDVDLSAERINREVLNLAVGVTQPNFNPRSPCGERQPSTMLSIPAATFQSTLPVWGATYCQTATCGRLVFQSTLPVWGATSFVQVFFCNTWQFQSTLPVWGATQIKSKCSRFILISIHAPRVGSD